MASLGYPLAGDSKYGDKEWNRELKRKTGLRRQFLHAWQTVFPEIEGEGNALSKATMSAPLPKDLREVLKAVGCDMEY